MSWGAIEITDFGDLNAPFNALTVGTYQQTTDWQNCDTFFAQRKQDVVLDELDQVMTRMYNGGTLRTGRNILEIGTGRGYLTTRIAQHIYDKRNTDFEASYLVDDVQDPDTNLYGGTVVFSVDNWQERVAHTTAGHGGISVPLRQAIGSDPVGGDVAETDVQQMMSNILHEATRAVADDNTSRNVYLDMLRLPGKTTDVDFVAGASAAPYFDATDADMFTTLRDTWNGGAPFAAIIFDTDSIDETVFQDMLLRAYNVLAPDGGAIIVDDLSWEDPETPLFAPMDSGWGNFFFQMEPYLFANHGDRPDIWAQPSHNQVVTYTAGGVPTSDKYTYAPAVRLIDEGAVPFLTRHQVWDAGQDWMGIFRKGSYGALGTTPLDYVFP